MINYYDKHKFISKKRLAELAGVSERTFSRYLATRRRILARDLQDQKVINSSPLYQQMVRELQLKTFFDGKWMKVTDIPHDF